LCGGVVCEAHAAFCWPDRIQFANCQSLCGVWVYKR